MNNTEIEVPERGWALIMSEHLKVVIDYGFYGITESIVNNFQIIRCYQSPAAFRHLHDLHIYPFLKVIREIHTEVKYFMKSI